MILILFAMARETAKNHPRYQDLKIRIAASIAGAYIVATYGGDDSFLSLLLTPVFYIEFAATLLITFLVVQLIYGATVRLDRRFDWHERPWQRTLLQLALGVLVPTLLTFLLAAAYFAYYGKNILERNYHIYVLPFIVALIGIVNLYYYIRFLLAERAQLKELSTSLSDPAATLPQTGLGIRKDITITGEMLTLFSNIKPEATLDEGTKTSTTFIARTPTRSFPIPTSEIAYFYRTGNAVYLRLFSGQEHLLALSLETIEGQLDRAGFFRVSRQMIVSYGAVIDFYPELHGKLGLTLNPPFAEETTISKLLAKSFKSWIQRKPL